MADYLIQPLWKTAIISTHQGSCDDTLNAGKTTVKDAVEAFLKLKKRKRQKTVNLYTSLNICQRVCGSLVTLRPPMLSTNTSRFWSTRASVKRPSTPGWALSSPC